MKKKVKNNLFVIRPYLDNGIWVFDDVKFDIIKEPFIAGADEFIGYALNKINLSKSKYVDGFNLVFSNKLFPEHNYVLVKKENKDDGTVYTVDNSLFINSNGKNELWLCPALKLYYNTYPCLIYIKIETDNEYWSDKW